ncbi:hypothetical protein V7S43_015694 [Phytophthora oleae]|uniref:Carboxylesterase type B domain-containing protein n=1 Tax=Phytophthora oleae TaxID=2107226 RepID=A0ABD3EY93_9STRA
MKRIQLYDGLKPSLRGPRIPQLGAKFTEMNAFRLSVAIGSLLAAATATDPPTVAVKNGSYYGVHQDSYDQELFLGMPYAQPPVGDLRFRIPQSLNSTWSEARNATEYSPECYGYGSDQWVLGNVISEDCLTTNVVRPSGVSEGANLPVGVWEASFKAVLETLATTCRTL